MSSIFNAGQRVLTFIQRPAAVGLCLALFVVIPSLSHSSMSYRAGPSSGVRTPTPVTVTACPGRLPHPGLRPVDEGKKEKGREGLFCYQKRSEGSVDELSRA